MNSARSHNDEDCIYEKDKTRWHDRFSKIDKLLISLSNWKESHEESAQRREGRIDSLDKKMDRLNDSQLETEGNIKVILEKLLTITGIFEVEKKEKEGNKRILVTIMFGILGLAVAWGGLRYQVAHNTKTCVEMKEHIQEDEGRWKIFDIRKEIEGNLHE